MIEIQQIRYFLAVSRYLNFGKAAQSLGVTQPTLSQQIQKLEADLRVVLFERSPKFVRLTADGSLFLPKAAHLLETYDQTLSVVASPKNELSGEVRLGFIPTIGPYVLPKIIRVLQRKAPQIRLFLSELTTTLLLEQLKQGVFDLAVLALPVHDTSLVTVPLGVEEFWIAVGKQHVLAQKNKVTLKEFVKHEVLMLKEGHCFRDQALEFCAQHNSQINVSFEGSSLVSVMNLAASGFGATLVPEMARHNAPKDLVFLPFAGTKPRRNIGLIWRFSYGLNLREKFVLQVLRESFGSSGEV